MLRSLLFFVFIRFFFCYFEKYFQVFFNRLNLSTCVQHVLTCGLRV